MLIRRLDMFQVEFVVRNIAAGSLSKRIGYPEGTPLKNPPVVEYYYKDDELGDPLLCQAHLEELAVVDPLDLAEATRLSRLVNSVLVEFFATRGVTLVDFKLEFGKDAAGVGAWATRFRRFWDSATGEKLDKDRFRRDMGGGSTYEEILRRVIRSGDRSGWRPTVSDRWP